MKSYKITGRTIPLGITGENAARSFAFDISGFESYDVSMVYCAPHSSGPRIIPMSKSDTKAVWAAQAEDVASAGIGVAVLYFRRGRELRKSEPYEVRVFADPTDYLNWLCCHKGVMT